MGVFDEIWAVSFTWVFHSYGWRKIGKDREKIAKKKEIVSQFMLLSAQ